MLLFWQGLNEDKSDQCQSRRLKAYSTLGRFALLSQTDMHTHMNCKEIRAPTSRKHNYTNHDFLVLDPALNKSHQPKPMLCSTQKTERSVYANCAFGSNGQFSLYRRRMVFIFTVQPKIRLKGTRHPKQDLKMLEIPMSAN